MTPIAQCRACLSSGWGDWHDTYLDSTESMAARCFELATFPKQENEGYVFKRVESVRNHSFPSGSTGVFQTLPHLHNLTDHAEPFSGAFLPFHM